MAFWLGFRKAIMGRGWAAGRGANFGRPSMSGTGGVRGRSSPAVVHVSTCARTHIPPTLRLPAPYPHPTPRPLMSRVDPIHPHSCHTFRPSPRSRTSPQPEGCLGGGPKPERLTSPPSYPYQYPHLAHNPFRLANVVIPFPLPLTLIHWGPRLLAGRSCSATPGYQLDVSAPLKMCLCFLFILSTLHPQTAGWEKLLRDPRLGGQLQVVAVGSVWEALREALGEVVEHRPPEVGAARGTWHVAFSRRVGGMLCAWAACGRRWWWNITRRRGRVGGVPRAWVAWLFAGVLESLESGCCLSSRENA